MIWKNPFVSKNSEQQMSEEQFLALFDGTVLQMIGSENLEKVSYVSSSPGAGKTSLFRVFSARVLNTIVSPTSMDQYKGIRDHLSRLGIIENEKVYLNSAIISCARGYSILDEMFQNGKRKQIFFALVNFRIAIALLKSIGLLLDIGADQYDRIHFSHIPTEMYSNEDIFQNGKTLYDWACKGERDLCKYLDSERNATISLSFIHTTLLVLKLFEPENILIDGKRYFHNTLIIFDDFHKLSDNQRSEMSEAIYTLKTNVGIWFGQRLEGVSNEHLISMDGSLKRDYNPNIVIDNYWPIKQTQFYKMLDQIGSKRIKEVQLTGYNSLSDCICEYDKTDSKENREKLVGFYTKRREEIVASPEKRNKYKEILDFLDKNEEISNFEKAIWIQCVIIQENRKNIGQLEMYLGERTSLLEFEEFVKKNKTAAKYYICQKLKMPFYFGYENLKVISSYNIEQFLFFAGTYYDNWRIKYNEPKGKKQLSAVEQEKVLIEAVKQKWQDMDYRYTNIDEIRGFLNAIAKVCIRSKDAERAAYAGGAYTGIGIDKGSLEKLVKSSQYGELRNKVGACLASKYLERREIDNGEIIVLYLNRWLCVYYGLPLAYGGWKKYNLEKLNHIENVADYEVDSILYQIEMEHL